MSAKKDSRRSRNNVLQFPLSRTKRRRENHSAACERVEYTNRKGKTYYLHVGKTKKGNPRYYFSPKDSGELVKAIPNGYEIYENPNAMVFLRKIPPKEILDEEIALLDAELKAHTKPSRYIIDTKGKVITIFWSSYSDEHPTGIPSSFGLAGMQDWLEQNAHFIPIFRFTLVDPQERGFIAERFCFKGSIDDWMDLLSGGPDSLQTLARRYVRHLGEDSFYELF